MIYPAMASIAWKETPVEQIVPVIAGAGYRGIELWVPHLERFIQEHGSLAALVAQLEAVGLQVPMISGYYDFAQRAEASLAQARRDLTYAEMLRAPLLRIFTGGGASEQAPLPVWQTVVAALKQLSGWAQAQDVGLALETHGGHLHDSTVSTLRLLAEVGTPNLYVNLDIFNLYARGEDPLAALQALQPYTRILHLKNARREGEMWRYGVPLAEGAMDYAPFLRALDASGYSGYATIEWFGNAPEQAARQELVYLRRQLSERLGGDRA